MRINNSKKSTGLLCLFAVLIVFAVSSIFAGSLHAQVSGATLSGTVSDASNAVVPNASVAVLEVDQGTTRTVTTDADGFYSVPNLVPGNYKVTVTSQGFQTYVRSGITLTVGEKQVLNITMTVGQVSQQVEVTGEAPVVELQSSAIGETVTAKTTVELPLNGRDWTALAALQPSVANLTALQQPIGSTSVRANRGFGLQLAMAGTRPQLNNYRIDGISAMDAIGGSPGSVLGVTLGVDAIGEFSVITSNYSAEYGRTAGGVVNATTKSGSNQLHGDAYWFIRDEGFDARNPFDPTSGGVAGRGIPPFHRNQYGGSLGGPIQKDKTFFFADYEGYRSTLGATALDTVPTDQLKSGIINVASGATFPSGCVATSTPNQCQVTVNANMKPYLALWPEYNDGLVANGLGNFGYFLQETNTIFTEDYVTARLDHKFSDKDSAYLTFLWNNGATFQDVPLNLWVYGNTSAQDFGSLEETHIFTSALVNSMRVGFDRINPQAGASISITNPLAGETALGAFPGLWCPSGSMPGATGYICNDGQTRVHPVFNSFQFYDDAFWTKGAHSLKFGFATERMQTNTSIILTPNGAYTFGSPAAWLQNQPTNFSGAAPTGRSEVGLRQTLFGGYIQDDWRFRKNLTLNLGLRYEMVTVPTEAENRLSNLPTYTSPTPNLGSPFFHNNSTKNFAPRIGVAWDPFGDGKTSVRAAFGIFDILPLNLYFAWGDARTAPFTQTLSYSNKATLDNYGCPTDCGAYPLGGPALAGFKSAQYNYVQSNPKASYMEIWNLNIERQLTPSSSINVGYVGSHGIHLVDREEEFNQVMGTQTSSGLLWPCGPNGTVGVSCAVGYLPSGTQAVPAPSVPPNGSAGQVVGSYWGGESSYNALTAQVTKRMSHGFQVQGSYTFAKSMDTGSSSPISDNFLNSVVNLLWYCLPCRRALSDFDITHSLVVNYIWDITAPSVGGAFGSHVLGGWELGGIVTVRSGAPFTPQMSGDPLGEQGSAPQDFPSYSATKCSSLTNNRSTTNYLNLSCFAVPSSSALTAQGLCSPFPTVPGSCENLMGNVGRNSVFGPGQITWDLSIFKNNYIRKVSETFNAQVRAELFNVLNRANLGQPAYPIFDTTGAVVAGAGAITTTSTTSRQVQLALKLIW